MELMVVQRSIIKLSLRKHVERKHTATDTIFDTCHEQRTDEENSVEMEEVDNTGMLQ